MSEPIIREVRDVLNRAELRRKLQGINDRIVNAFPTKLKARRFSSLTSERIHYEGDPDDEMYIFREPE